ncbi:MAG: hypothetical protein JXB48_02055, partial [Candidatus Latescibacteria bacterium]|nr:hypothetical protein [Candidatus Latescibacterota bacterium]
MPKSHHKSEKIIFSTFLLIFAIYSGIFIYKTSFVIEGERYFSLFDDAMVSMRYARNLAEGNGLVMNPGERVEGITNPLWTFWMAAAHFLPVPLSKISLIIQITAAVCLLLNLVFVRKIALFLSGNNPNVSLAAVILTAFNLPLVNWSLQGMEVSVLTLLISCIVWLLVRPDRQDKIPLEVYILLGIGTLIRIDMAVPFLVVWFLLLVSNTGDLRRKHILYGGIVFAVFLGGQTVLRLLYYGDIFPNTYYLKMTGYPFILRLGRGFIVWLKFVWRMNPIFFIVPVLTVIYTRARDIVIPAVIIAFQMLYSIYVGGDAWDDWGGSNRYIAIVMPQFFILLALGLSKACGLIEKKFPQSKSTHSKGLTYTALRDFLF